MGRISKRGDKYLRMLLVHGARAGDQQRCERTRASSPDQSGTGGKTSSVEVLTPTGGAPWPTSPVCACGAA
ncbi:MAG: hypothetical protein R3E83_17140 [Burkholderiaceae bacterium]